MQVNWRGGQYDLDREEGGGPEYVPPPLDVYKVQILEGTDIMNGKMLNLTFEIFCDSKGIIMPEGKNRAGVTFNRINDNAATVRIAGEQLTRIGWCTVYADDWDTTEQISRIPFWAKMGPAKDKPQYTNIFEVWALDGSKPWKNRSQQKAQFQPALVPQLQHSGYAQPAQQGYQPPAQPQPPPQQAQAQLQQPAFQPGQPQPGYVAPNVAPNSPGAPVMTSPSNAGFRPAGAPAGAPGTVPPNWNGPR